MFHAENGMCGYNGSRTEKLEKSCTIQSVSRNILTIFYNIYIALNIMKLMYLI